MTQTLLGIALVGLMLNAPLIAAADLPNAKLTAGVIDTAITQQNIHITVCVKGYAKTVRPPAYYTNKLKKSQIIEYGYTDTNPQHYEEDHLIPLSIGGSATDPQNLWPQPRLSEWNAQKKDILELKIYQLVCDGVVPLNQARLALANHWIDAYKLYLQY